MDYKKASIAILDLVGGESNIESHTNCMTRLRLNLKDNTKVQLDELKKLDGVMGVVTGDQLQIIVGPGHAQRLKDEFSTFITNQNSTSSFDSSGSEGTDLAAQTKAKVKASQSTAFQKGLKHIGNIFIPLIPGFVAVGLITAIANIWKTGIDPNIVKNPWFLLFAAMGGLVGGSLHILVGINASKEFGGTPVLGAIAGGFIYLPQFAGIAASNAAVAASGALNALLKQVEFFENKDKATEAINALMTQLDSFNAPASAAAQPLMIPFLNIKLSSGLGGVMGVIFAAFIFAIIEKKVRKIVPASLDLFIVPFVTIILGSVITLLIVMPASALLMRGITYVLVNIALEKGGIIGGFFLSSLFLPLVMLGLHQGLTPVHADLIASTDYTVLLPILATAGAGQVGMAIAVYFKTKDKMLRKTISSALPVGFLGIGEPLIYGVSLPLFYPFITACIGAGFGGAVIAYATQNIAPVGATAIGPSGLVLIPLIAGKPLVSSNMLIWYVLGLLASYVGGFLLTYFFGYKEKMLERLHR